LRVQIDLKFY
jgi:hypothetical protein